MAKEFKRSKKDRWIGGVAGGLAEYFDMDPMLMRIIWIAGTLFTGVITGVVVYILIMLLVKE